MKKFRRITAFMMVILVLFVVMNPVLGQEEPAQQEKSEITEFYYLQVLKEVIMNAYRFEVTDTELLEGALRKIIEENPQLLDKAIEGMFSSLDQHSKFFNEEEYEKFSTTVNGQFGGIGIMVTDRNGYVTVLAPMDNTPGKRAGLKPGDKIVFIDGTDVSGYDANMAVQLMRGEPGTPVVIGIKRAEYEGILYFNIVRDIIKINPVTYKILNDKIGYIRISDFNTNTGEYFKEALDSFDEANITNIIIDVRNNPGGALNQVANIANYFVPKRGPIMHFEYKDGSKETIYSKLKGKRYDPIVLINEWSASASEILAGAIQDSKAGKVIGTKSFGKGTVQQLIPLRKGGAIKLTIAKFLTPNGTAIDGNGIKPDIEIKNEKKKIDMNQFEKMVVQRRITIGDTGRDVLAAEQRLKLLGYDITEPDEIFDQQTFDAVMVFQAEQKLHPYGVLDFTTLAALERTAGEVEIEIDRQLAKAIEIFIN